MSHLPEWASTKWLQRVAELQPEMFQKFVELEEAVYGSGKLPAKTKELIAVAVTHVTQCDACMEYHTHKAKQAGATDEEIVEALFVAMELRAGAALGHHAASARAMESHRRQEEKESAAAPGARARPAGERSA
jgi:AhpD family alkylhydroperoxidase